MLRTLNTLNGRKYKKSTKQNFNCDILNTCRATCDRLSPKVNKF